MLRTRILGVLSSAIFVVAVACATDPTHPIRDGEPTEGLHDLSAATGGGRLLACPTYSETSVSVYLSSRGDTLRWNGNTVMIPAGAIPQTTHFTVTRRAGAAFVLDIHADGYDHYRFLKPITVVLAHPDCPSSSAALSVEYVDPVTNAPLEWMGGVADTVAQTVTFTTIHLSGYAVAE